MTKATSREGRSASQAEKHARSTGDGRLSDLRSLPVAPPYPARRWLLLVTAVLLAAWIAWLAYVALFV